MLKGNTIFYWKDAAGAEIGAQQGDFMLHSTTAIAPVKSKGKYFHFAIVQPDRTYKLRCDTERLARSWVRACADVVERRKHIDGEDSGISDPFNTTHEQVCFFTIAFSFDFQNVLWVYVCVLLLILLLDSCLVFLCLFVIDSHLIVFVSYLFLFGFFLFDFD